MGNKDAKKLRKEIRRIAKDGISDVGTKEVVRTFVDQVMSLPLSQRLVFSLGLVVKRRGMLHINA